MLSTLPHARKLFIFLALSVADLGLTWHLLGNSSGQIGEANPLANWLLSHGGWAGLAVFKAATVLVVVGAAMGVELRRPAGGGFVLGLACGALTLVVGWSVALSVSLATRTAGLIDPEVTGLMREEDQIDRNLSMASAYRDELFRLSGELAEARISLADAVGQITRTERAGDPGWQKTLRELFPLPTLHQSLAAHLIHHAQAGIKAVDPDRAAVVARRLEGEFYETYPSPPVGPLDRPVYVPRPPQATAAEIEQHYERNPDAGPTNKEGTRHPSGFRGRRRLPPHFIPGRHVPTRTGDTHAIDPANPAGLSG